MAHTAASKLLATSPLVREWTGWVTEEMWPSATRVNAKPLLERMILNDPRLLTPWPSGQAPWSLITAYGGIASAWFSLYLLWHV